ncbi:cobyric acid synthase [Paenibacillus aurantius]|uniref:Cobyric acid synthase n=1 Tax=Paenibacillus aurantius TaxID=2918900 RepID=A0AA96RDW5_9BACL|nr:cobyric acid synthase [Paenibacillus aurantius]WNQ10227.1 cobyric acid synthase [Paenibacillus aurantius]
MAQQPYHPDLAPAPARTLMLQGTASDVGKSLLTAALCRIFMQDGRRVAPFKSQNMSLNSYVTPDGKEIGRAQGMQADACRIPATTNMNPILLKPSRDMEAQVVVHGKPFRTLDARTYRESYLPKAEQIVKEALHQLRSEYELVVLEGAGSPAEVNLKDRDIVNMRLAGWADAPVLLVADIDRGGVFASLVGTMEILTPEERDRVAGFIINKFRGDVSLLQPGLDWLEERTGKPVLGVIPFLPNLALEDEDSASLDAIRSRGRSGRKGDPALELAVIRLPRISNFTDFDPLWEEEDVQVRYISRAEEFGSPDAVLLPGSKNTAEDLRFLRESGLEEELRRYVADGGRLTGLCGGYQMMGTRLVDTDFVESEHRETEGLGYFPMETHFALEKRTERVVGFAECWDSEAALPVEGYEIHMGVSRFMEAVEHPFMIRNERNGVLQDDFYPEGAITPDGKLWGTYIHGILHNDEFRRCWLNGIREEKGWVRREGTLFFRHRRESAFDRLADHVRAHLDMQRIYEMIGTTKPEARRMPL